MKNKDRVFKQEYYHILAVMILIERKLKTKIDLVKDKQTRSDSDEYDLMLVLLHRKINRRENNQRNKFNFKEECNTSANQLIHLFGDYY